MRRWLQSAGMRQGLLLLGGVGLVLGGLIGFGQLAQEQLADHPRYTIHFADIQCEPPAGMSRVDFLDEVQYLSGISSDLPLLHQDLPPKLARAFARHPWVQQVARIHIQPSKQIVVELIYRQPVLAVRWQGQLRAVDAAGILLPANAPTARLPIFSGEPAAPQGAAGTPWGDPSITRAAQEAAKG